MPARKNKNRLLHNRILFPRMGFTFIEVMMTIAIMAMVFTIAMPIMQNDDHFRVVAAARIVSSDLELAQVMTLSDPGAPVIVVFSTTLPKYHLAHPDTFKTPLNREDNGLPYVVEMGLDRAATAQGVTISTTNLTNNILAYSAQGGLVDFTRTPSITLTYGKEWITLTIAPTTGTITETAGTNP